jgi:hypothetical protein
MKNNHLIQCCWAISLFLFLLFSGCKSRLPVVSKNASVEAWESLFNGVSLDGWDVKIRGYDLNDNYHHTFIVEDGMIKVNYNGYKDFNAHYGHLFYQKPFSYYRLKLEYRFVGTQCPGGEGWALRNSGVMLHGQPASTMLKNQDFPISIEAQFLGGDGQHERHTLNVCTPGTNIVLNGKFEETHCIDSNSKTCHGEQWVQAEFLVLGDSLIQHILDGKVVLEYAKPQIGGGVVNNYDPAVKKDGKPLIEGSISLQSESHPIHFRNIQLLNLEGCTDPKAKNYKSYFVKSKNTLCVY